ncbi:MAG TPA: hypothetical protein VLI69_05585 [Gammaproteobacteria bacterium]|nr:hypothetical protein [Gammaproteobacteria bacterium]
MQSYQNLWQSPDFLALICNAAREKNPNKLLPLLESVSIDVSNPLYDCGPIGYLAAQNDMGSVEFLLTFGASYARAAGGFARGKYVTQAYAYLESARIKTPDHYRNALLRTFAGFIQSGLLEEANKIFVRLKDTCPHEVPFALKIKGEFIARFRPEEVDAFLSEVDKEYQEAALKGVMEGLGRANQNEKIRALLAVSEKTYAVKPFSLYPFLIRGFFKGGHNKSGHAYLKEKKDMETLPQAVSGAAFAGNEELISYYLHNQLDAARQLVLLEEIIGIYGNLGYIGKIQNFLAEMEEQENINISSLYHKVGHSLANGGHYAACIVMLQQTSDEDFRMNLLQGMQYGFVLGDQRKNSRALLEWVKEHETEDCLVDMLCEKTLLIARVFGAGEYSSWLDEVRKNYPLYVISVLETIVEYEAEQAHNIDENIILKALISDVKAEPDGTLKEARKLLLNYLANIAESNEEALLLKVEKYDELMAEHKLSFEQAQAWVGADTQTYLLQCKKTMPDDVFDAIGSFLMPLDSAQLFDLSQKMNRRFPFFQQRMVPAQLLLDEEKGSLKRKREEESQTCNPKFSS